MEGGPGVRGMEGEGRGWRGKGMERGEEVGTAIVKCTWG